jgi:uncharacterized protein YlaI
MTKIPDKKKVNRMSNIYYCPECKSKLEEISGCGAISYFCNTCKKLISRKKILPEEEMQKKEK